MCRFCGNTMSPRHPSEADCIRALREQIRDMTPRHSPCAAQPTPSPATADERGAATATEESCTISVLEQ